MAHKNTPLTILGYNQSKTCANKRPNTPKHPSRRDIDISGSFGNRLNSISLLIDMISMLKTGFLQFRHFRPSFFVLLPLLHEWNEESHHIIQIEVISRISYIHILQFFRKFISFAFRSNYKLKCLWIRIRIRIHIFVWIKQQANRTNFTCY